MKTRNPCVLSIQVKEWVRKAHMHHELAPIGDSENLTRDTYIQKETHRETDAHTRTHA